MLMEALMGGIPEVVIWKLVGKGAKKEHTNPWIKSLAFFPQPGNKEGWTRRNQEVSNIWKCLNHYFFALANLPDLLNFDEDAEALENEDPDKTSLQHLDQSTTTPLVHKLTNEEQLKYQPLFDNLVDIEKLHLCHGKPSTSKSVATIQKKSLVELWKAHHAFSVVCQQYQITYYLDAVSCGSTGGWTQVPQTLASYIHGQSAAKTVKGKKPQQPSDERKTRLVRELNNLGDAVSKGAKFPKVSYQAEEFKDKGLPIHIVQKEGSALSKKELESGHRLAKDSTVKLWLHTIKNGLFVVELIPESEMINDGSAMQHRSQKSKKKNQSSCSQPDSEPQITQNSNANSIQPQPSSTQPQPSTSGIQPSKSLDPAQRKLGDLKQKLQMLAKGDVHNKGVKQKQQETSVDSDTAEDSETPQDANTSDESQEAELDL
ncbi:hypothetical protein DFH28DRAFT_1080790 [Melampsora americana]|nr:hypothetical protein DFH28DRAFT_1080790 [Melampsora americana]